MVDCHITLQPGGKVIGAEALSHRPRRTTLPRAPNEAAWIPVISPQPTDYWPDQEMEA